MKQLWKLFPRNFLVTDSLSLEHTTWLIFFMAYYLPIFCLLSSLMSFVFVLAHLNDAVDYIYCIIISRQMKYYIWNMNCKGYRMRLSMSI